jgi:IS30 family transposase
MLVSAREGIPLNSQKFYDNDKIISEGLAKGQHLYQIMQAHDLGVCQSTVYNHAKKGYLSACNTDFPRKVKFKTRKQKPRDYVAKGLKIGRTYADFELFRTQNQISHWVEMDTVIGRVGGKAILTLHFTLCNFMLGFVVDNLTSACISAKITQIKNLLQQNDLTFGQLFPVILTDNGGEFADVFAIENDLQGAKETNLFFCDPCKSWQKAHIEKNHTLLRDILPKGTSFDELSQDKLNIVISHVNNTARPCMNGKSPFEMFCFAFSNAIPLVFDIEYISPQNVIQSPKLFNNIK